MQTAVLLINCPDQKGIVASVSHFLYQNNANIIHADQHQDNELNLFFMRVEWDLTGFKLDIPKFKKLFAKIAEKYQMTWQLAFSDYRPKIAILVSKEDHCLADLLYRHKNNELKCEIPLIISNHKAAKPLADFYQIPFYEIPIKTYLNSAKGNLEKAKIPVLLQSPGAPCRGEEAIKHGIELCRKQAEEKILKLLKSHNIDLVVLARYMQIISPEFLGKFPNQIINVHHSFLPAFIGRKPYHQAYERGVKIIGATSHYVTHELDQGPIIEQDVVRISHRDSIQDLIQKGRDLEKIVLSRAVRWHTENRILLYSNKTVVFD